ncbi:MAG: SixA phosphatase family protein [Rhodoferax sp.]
MAVPKDRALDLVLWRHAEAIDLELVGDDMLRTLTPRGEKQAHRMGAWLDRQLPSSTKVFSSPALRADQTAQALERKYKTHAGLAPLAGVDDLLDVTHWTTGSGCVLVVGHQPTLGQTAARLLGIGAGQCSVKKGAVWWLRMREREAATEVTVLAVLSPDLV